MLPSWLDVLVSWGWPIVILLGWWLWDRCQTKVQSRLIAFQARRESPSPARGLILLLSPYEPPDRNIDRQVVQATLERVRRGESLVVEDFQAINLAESNLRPQIGAIDFHHSLGSLRDVWLIASQTTEQSRGSEDAALLLEQYLRAQYPGLSVHRRFNGEDLVIEPWNYTSIWEQAERIFRSSGFREEVLLADVTGGTKMMSVALAMACIPPRRRIQYMDAERDAEGQPVPRGQMVPVVMDVGPILYRYTN